MRCIAMSKDRKVLVLVSSDNTVQRWDAQREEQIGDPICGHEDPAICVSVSSDGNVILSGSIDREIRRWDAQSRIPNVLLIRGYKLKVTGIR